MHCSCPYACRATLRIRVGDQRRPVGVVVPSLFSRSATACSVEPAILSARIRLAMAGWSWRGRPSFTPAALLTANASRVRVPMILRSHSATDAVTLASNPPVGSSCPCPGHRRGGPIPDVPLPGPGWRSQPPSEPAGRAWPLPAPPPHPPPAAPVRRPRLAGRGSWPRARRPRLSSLAAALAVRTRSGWWLVGPAGPHRARPGRRRSRDL